MKRIATSISFVLVLALIGLLAAGCGGKKSSPAVTTPGQTLPVVTDPSIKAFANPENCGQMEYLGISYVQAANKASGPERAALQKFLDKGPPGVRKDFSVMANVCGFTDIYYALTPNK